MSETNDAIVIGAGVIGASTAFHLAKLDGLTLAFGFSGHGFRLAPAVGLVLAQQVLGQATDVDIAADGLARFADGRLLTGAYGVGSIS